MNGLIKFLLITMICFPLLFLTINLNENPEITINSAFASRSKRKQIREARREKREEKRKIRKDKSSLKRKVSLDKKSCIRSSTKNSVCRSLKRLKKRQIRKDPVYKTRKALARSKRRQRIKEIKGK